MGLDISEFWHSYRKLSKMMEDTNLESDIVNEFFHNIKMSYFQFSKNLRSVSETFMRRISENRDKITERNYLYYQFANNYLTKMADLNKSFSENIDMSACISFMEFSENIKSGNNHIIDIIRKDLKNVDNSRMLLRKS
jgi:hypothetical protein